MLPGKASSDPVPMMFLINDVTNADNTAYPVALLLMGNAKVAVLTFVLPFLISTCGGTLIAAILIGIMDKTKVLDYLKRQIR